MNLKEIAHKINEKALDYEIGELQSIRKDIKGLKKKAASAIFVD